MKAIAAIGILAVALFALYKYRQAQAQQPLGSPAVPPIPPEPAITLPASIVVEDTGMPGLSATPIEGAGSGSFSGWRSGYSAYPDSPNNVVTPGTVKPILNPNLESLGTFAPNVPAYALSQIKASQLSLAGSGRFNY